MGILCPVYSHYPASLVEWMHYDKHHKSIHLHLWSFGDQYTEYKHCILYIRLSLLLQRHYVHHDDDERQLHHHRTASQLRDQRYDVAIIDDHPA